MDETIGKWSEDKLEILRKYLGRYTQIMRKQNWCKGFHYIDAFACSGEHKARDEEKRFIDGSPRVALKIEHPFTSYTFIEINEERLEKLNNLSTEFPQMHITIEKGDCNKVIVEKMFARISSKYERGFIFLDPYGLDVSMDTVKRIASRKIFEVFINFPVMAINRTVKSKNPAVSTQKQKDRMNRVMGDCSWVDENSSEQLGLFSEIGNTTVYYGWPRLVESYRIRLSKIFKYVSRSLIMRETKSKSPLYALIFAGHNETGVKIMNYILKKYPFTVS